MSGTGDDTRRLHGFIELYYSQHRKFDFCTRSTFDIGLCTRRLSSYAAVLLSSSGQHSKRLNAIHERRQSSLAKSFENQVSWRIASMTASSIATIMRQRVKRGERRAKKEMGSACSLSRNGRQVSMWRGSDCCCSSDPAVHYSSMAGVSSPLFSNICTRQKGYKVGGYVPLAGEQNRRTPRQRKTLEINIYVYICNIWLG